MKIKDILSGALGLIFPPVCMHCGEHLDFRSREALCDKCAVLYAAECETICKDCFLPVAMCECVPVTAGKEIGKAYHALEYDPSKENVTRSLVLTAKDHNYKFLYELIAKTLEESARAHIGSFTGMILTYVPRSPEKVRETGVDQAKIASRLLAKRLGTDFVEAIGRKGNVQQKLLDVDSRRKNAQSAYYAKSDAAAKIGKKTVILYDDVMTTGSTMSVCAGILKSMGARRVICLNLARAYKKK